MNKFLQETLRFSIIGVISFILILGCYIYDDTFKTLKPHENYSYPYVVPNRDFISTEMFIKNYKHYNYNSFIFGSSRTTAFKPISWSKHLKKNAKPFMFDASNESIYGIYTKLKYLDSINMSIDNVLIIMCRDVTFARATNSTEHLYIKHPIITGESTLDFQVSSFKAFLNPRFLACLLIYKTTGKFKSYMTGYIENRKITYDAVTNEMNIVEREQEITESPKEYYASRPNLFYQRDNEKIDPIIRIQKEHLFMLKEIKRILDKNKTNYKVVLSPLYEQIKFNPADLLTLKTLFNKNLYDFSGKNRFSEPKTNFYEISHYRPSVGDSIMKLLYK